MNERIDPPSSACRHPRFREDRLFSRQREKDLIQSERKSFHFQWNNFQDSNKKTPLFVCTILLPLAGEGADRRMRVD
jgi:hypothetical protein